MGGLKRLVRKVGHALGSVAKTAGDVAVGGTKATVDVTVKVAEGAGHAAEGAAKTMEHATGDIADGVKDLTKGGTTAVGKAAEDVAKGAADVAAGAIEATSELAERVVKGAGEGLEQGAQNAGHAIEQVGHAAGDLAENIFEEAERLFGKTVAEVGRAYKNVNELASASYHFLENQVDGTYKLYTGVTRDMLRGHFDKAVFKLCLGPIELAEENTLAAIQESDFMRYIANAAASTYGGPGGAAAFAAWYAYRQTGNLKLAVKAGAIAWATTSSVKLSNDMPANSIDKQAQKILVSASIGGAAIAASGGSHEQVLSAFVRGAEMSGVQATYEEFMKQPLDGRPATKPPMVKLDADGHPYIRGAWQALRDENGDLITDPDGYAQIDITTTPPEISHVGLAANTLDAPYLGITEASGVMQDLAHLPYVNNMAYFHDQWAAIAQMDDFVVKITILPAIVYTAIGADSMLTDPATKEVIGTDKKN